jgi:hypothetical protein
MFPTFEKVLLYPQEVNTGLCVLSCQHKVFAGVARRKVAVRGGTVPDPKEVCQRQGRCQGCYSILFR